MLTGDKMETATSIAVSSKLVSRTDVVHSLVVVSSAEAEAALSSFPVTQHSSMVIDGASLRIKKVMVWWVFEYVCLTKLGYIVTAPCKAVHFCGLQPPCGHML